jgi:alkaline phosphatase D
VNRREIVLGVPSLWLASGARANGGERAQSFPYGVASGDPTQSSIVLWTALASPVSNGVRWWLRRSSDGRLVRAGQVEAHAAADFTVKLRVAGLSPGERYEYGFEYGSAVSPVGRTRTLPAAGTRTLRLAVFSCSKYSSGWFHAYRHAAEDPNLDFAVHLGDYVYEGASMPAARATGRFDVPDRELVTLDDYRARHALYKRDLDLQALHAALPLMPIWDDHEFADDASMNGENTSAPEKWPQRVAAARQAYFEWLPTMAGADGQSWRRRRIGGLADLYLLDTRIEGRDAQLDPRDPRFASPERQLLGRKQERWLAEELARPRAAAWTVLASSVILSPLSWPAALRKGNAAQAPGWAGGLLDERIARSEAGLAGNPDAWDGYPAAQRRLLDMLDARAGRTLVLSGDTHSSWAFELCGAGGSPLGWEVGVPSVTSEASLEYTGLHPAEVEALFRTRNPRMKYLEPSARGYVVVELGERRAVAEWRYVSSVLEPAPRWRVGHRLEMALS